MIMDQNACSSPHLNFLAWERIKDAKIAKELFWKNLYQS